MWNYTRIDDHAFSWPQFFVLLCVFLKTLFVYCNRNSICYMGVSMANPMICGRIWHTSKKKNFASGLWNRNDSDYFLLMTFVWNLTREMYKTYIRFPESGSIFYPFLFSNFSATKGGWIAQHIAIKLKLTHIDITRSPSDGLLTSLGFCLQLQSVCIY